jgi:uncharacterized protein (TIGR03437 family)
MPAKVLLTAMALGVAAGMPFPMVASVNPPALIYSAAGIVNAASYSAGSLAPNAIASIYGQNLSFATEALTPATETNGGLPVQLGGVAVYIGPYEAGLYYVSPLQINLLIPSVLVPGTYPLIVVRNDFAGPTVLITLNVTGPAFFADGSGNVIAQHLNGALVSAGSPAVPGEWVVIYVEGLGRTVPDADMYLPSDVAAPIVNLAEFSLMLNGVAVPAGSIYYAGITPGLSGLYQINVQLPADAPPTPPIQIAIGAAVSAGQTQIPIA